MIKKIFYFFQSVFIYLFYFLSKIIGLKLSRFFFSLIFKKIGNLFKSKKIIYDNLNRIKPGISQLEKEKIINKMWSNYGKTFIEYVYLGSFKKKSNHIILKNRKVIDEIAKKNKPVIFISGHFANFELMSMEITKKKNKFGNYLQTFKQFFFKPIDGILKKKIYL